MRKALPIAAGLGALAIVGTVVQAPAAHADTVLFQGRDTAITSTDESTGWVCDNERDGHYVYAWWYPSLGVRHGEKDGGDQGCDRIDLRGLWLEKVVFCEYVPGDNNDKCVTHRF